MAELFARAARMQAPKIPIVADEPKTQGFYEGFWDAIVDVSNYSVSDSGSVEELAPYTDEGSRGPRKDEDATEQDLMPKPISVSKRRREAHKRAASRAA